MNVRHAITVLGLTLLTLVVTCRVETRDLTSTEWADLVLRNGRIYTVDSKLPWAGAVAILDGKIAGVGTSEEISDWIGPNTEVYDLRGRMLMPGIVDMHSHPFITPWYGSMNLSLQRPDSHEAILAEAEAAADDAQDPSAQKVKDDSEYPAGVPETDDANQREAIGDTEADSDSGLGTEPTPEVEPDQEAETESAPKPEPKSAPESEPPPEPTDETHDKENTPRVKPRRGVLFL